MNTNTDEIQTLHFDYIIIGSGVAGLQLAVAMSKHHFFCAKKIAIIDFSKKKDNDKTFCFWEKGIGKWDNLVSKSWHQAYFYSSENKELRIDLTPYTYKKIQALDFYNYCISVLKKNTQFSFFYEKVDTVTETDNTVCVNTNQYNFSCSHLFDSRIPEHFKDQKKAYAYVDQSFSGFEIETNTPVFNKDNFTMMDYRFTWKNSTSFMYILPESGSKALVEYTFFAPFTISATEFETQLKNYLNIFFKGIKYTIKKKETGVIPMTNFPFNKQHTLRTTKIGTAGGWVKASTGYSFKRSEKFVNSIIQQLIAQKPVIGHQPAARFQFYDQLLLKILEKQNTKGPEIFYKMYKNTHPAVFFKFLDEETTLLEELKLILKLPYLPFIKALIQ
ncbi:lycopene cyclase family protein [Aquimarina agarivorans]|uniref:lycopene cyclase family protein n=1 Tax=Aquimarina agarivorans TaxID=980584 RepID=UPI001EE68D01|nr:lycopene cyclase family protein [Aquimarina agarivorans]